MARKGEAVWRRVRCWDTAANAPATGEAANLTLKIAADNGAPATLTNNASIAEESYGYYRVQVTTTENDCWTAQLSGECSSSDVVVFGTQWDNEASQEDIADQVWDEDLSGHTIDDSAGEELHAVKVVAVNDYDADDTADTIEFDDEDGSVLITHTLADTANGHTRTKS